MGIMKKSFNYGNVNNKIKTLLEALEALKDPINEYEESADNDTTMVWTGGGAGKRILFYDIELVGGLNADQKFPKYIR